MKKKIIAILLCLCMGLVLMPASLSAVTSTAPTISGPTDMTLTPGYSAVSTAAFVLTGVPTPTVVQDETYGGKIVFNNTTKKIDITAGLAVGTYPVVLNAPNGIAPNAALTFTLTVGTSGSLTTLFNPTNGFGGNMFDVEVIGTVPLRMDSFAISLAAEPDTTCSISVYYREGGYLGHETAASDWTFVGRQTGVTGANFYEPTPLAVGGVVLQPGIRYGFYIAMDSYDGMSAAIGCSAVPSGTEYSNGSLKIISGNTVQDSSFAGEYYGNFCWNGIVYYTAASSDATLSGLTLTGAALNEIFSPDTTAYTATTSNSSITLGASLNDPSATMTLQVGTGTPAVWDGSASAQALAMGTNVFTVTVTAPDLTTRKTYTVTVTRNAAPTITGPTEMALTTGYAAVSTAVYTLTGTPAPTVVQDKTYNGKIVWNNTTKKIDIAAGLAVGNYPVVLTASNGVSPSASLTFTLKVGASGALTTLFATNNSFAGNMFDMQTVGTVPIRIDSFDVNLSYGNTPCTVKVYYREGGYAGYESNASAWTLLGSQSGVVPAGTDRPTPLAVGGVALKPGIRYGFYVTVSDYSASGCQMLYTNMLAGTEYTDGNLKLISGIGKGIPNFTGEIFGDRVWNGTVYYTLITESASLSGPSEMTLLQGYTATSTAAFTVKGIPAPTVTQDKTYGGKIVWNNATKKLDVAPGLTPGTYPVKLTADNGTTALLTFTLKVNPVSPVNPILLGITPPAAITGLANGTAKTAEALKLPGFVTLVIDSGNDVGSVVWDLASCAYNPALKTAQTFTVSGVVTVPHTIDNKNRISPVVTVSVTVNAAEAATSAVSSTASPASQAPASQAPASQAVSSVSGNNDGASVPAMGSGGSGWPVIAVVLTLAAAGILLTMCKRPMCRGEVKSQK